MPKIIFIITTILVSATAAAQIRTLSVEEKPTEIPPYDSLSNINLYNYASQIGQMLYVMPTQHGERGRQSFDLYTKGGNYDSMKGKYFVITAIQIGTHRFWDTELVLKERETCTTILHRADENWDFDDFLTVGYFERLQSTYVGKKFVYKGGAWPIRRIGDRKRIWDISGGSVFDVVDIMVDEQYSVESSIAKESPVIAILHNELYGRVYVSIQDIAKTDDDIAKHIQNFISFEEYQRNLTMTTERKSALKNKYGATNGALISDGKVRVGFTKQMCIDAWGEPSDINTTSGSWGVHEQWVYGDGNYLYFENGIVSSIQN